MNLSLEETGLVPTGVVTTTSTAAADSPGEVAVICAAESTV